MITTIVLLTLVFAIIGKPVGWLVKKLEGVDWKRLARDAWSISVSYSKRAGRAATRQILLFYYSMTEGNISTLDRILVYAAIVYVAVPRDFLPKSVFGWIGLIDDTAAIAYVYGRIKKSITREVEQKVEETLDK